MKGDDHLNAKEAAVIIGIIKTEYGFAFGKMDKGEWKTKVKTWEAVLADMPFQKVQSAVYAYISEGNRNPPTCGMIRQMILKQSQPELNGYEAWQMVRRSLSDIQRASQSFEAFPPVLKKVVGNAAQLRQWGMTPLDELERWVKPRFIKYFDEQASGYGKDNYAPAITAELDSSPRLQGGNHQVETQKLIQNLGNAMTYTSQERS